VGVNDYATLEDLRYCAADMRALERQLVDSDFEREHVFVVHSGAGDSKYQPFRANINKQLELILGFLEPEDLLLVAFSGHGVHLDGKSYLCPAEADMELPETLIPIDEVYKKLQMCRASLKLLIIDACRNDPRPVGRRGATPKQDLTRLGQAFQQPPQGIVLLASCAPGEVSMESEEFGHGVFMNYLIDGLAGNADEDGDGRISLSEAAQHAGLKTKLYVARKYNDSQRPYLTGDTTIEALAYSIRIHQGPTVFRRHCAACHNHFDPANPDNDSPHNIVIEKPTASNLWRFGSRDWVSGVLDPAQIAGPRYFGNTALREGEMCMFVNDTFGSQSEDLRGDELTEFHRKIENVIIALTWESGLSPSTRSGLEERVVAGRNAIVNEFACVDCHKFHDDGELGLAPDLTGYASRDWLTAFIANPEHERFYPHTNDRMPAFAPDVENPAANRLTKIELGRLVAWLRGEQYESALPIDAEGQ
jgi:mono/diheme cytochrome c family protein